MQERLDRNELTIKLIRAIQSVEAYLHVLGSQRLDPSILLIRDNIGIVRELVEHKAMSDAIGDIAAASGAR